MKLNEKIAYYRRAKRMSQEELAARAGVSRQAVSKWELGEAAPDIGKLLALSKAFGVTTDHLLNDGEEPERAAPPVEPQTPPPPPQRGQLDNLPGFIGRMVRRWGWLAGIYLGGMSMGGMGWTYSGPPELEGAVMDALGVAPHAPQASPFSGVQSFFLGFSTLILVIGIVMVVGGLVLAYVLWSQGRKGD